MKKIYKGLITAALSLALAMSLVVTSWAAGAGLADAIMGDVAKDFFKWCLTPVTANEGEDEIVEAMNYINSVWRTAGNSTGTVEVTYQTMSDLVADLNMNGIPCQIAMWRGSGATGYVIKGTGKAPVCGGVAKVDITGKYLTNTAGAAFLAKSKTEITTPDTGTTTPTTPTITFDDTNIVNAVEGVFDQLTWVIRCQFEQMQDTLVNGRILLNINNLISKNIIPYLEDILVANTAASGTLQAFYHSFESKFSDLDTVFGTDTSMEVHNGDLLTWDSTSRGFTSATADGTADTVRLTPTTTLSGYNVGWTSDGNFSITPVGGGYFPDTLDVGTGTVTMPVIKTTETEIIANPELNQYVPEGYTQYEDYYGEIDLGVVPQRGMTLDTGLDLTSLNSISRSRLQYCFGVDGLSMAISEDQQSLVVTSGSTSYNWSYDFSKGYTVRLHLYWKFGSSWRLGTMSSGVSLTGFPSTSDTLYLDGVNTTSYCDRASSFWHNIKLKDSSGNLLYHFVPVKRDSDGAEGLYRVEYNAGVYSGGTFLTAKYAHASVEIPATVESTVTKPGNITRIYRDAANTWRAVGSDGKVYGFTVDSAQALWAAFPIYDYGSLSDMTSLPDGTYYFTWSGTAQTVTINYQAYSKWFAYIANQIAYNRNWLDERLDRLSLSSGGTADLQYLEQGVDSIDQTTFHIYDDVQQGFTTLEESLTSIESALSNLGITGDDITNITVDISADNDAHNVFWITGEDGEEQSVTEFTGDLTKASGRLLSLLYRLVFADALSTVDGDLDGFEDFFTSQEQAATQSMESPYEEENVWLVS